MRSIFVLLIIYFLIACDAPRNNPFDPGSDDYQAPNTLTLKVSHLGRPSDPIENIILIEPNLNLMGKSNSEGIVDWQFERNPDSVFIQTNPDLYFSKNVTIKYHSPEMTYNLQLNAKPTIFADSLISIYNNIDGSTEIYFRTGILDLDGNSDIKKVRLYSPDVWNSYLSNEGGTDIYSTDQSIRNIDPTLTPESLIEIPFNLSILNQNADSLQKNDYYVKRVITTELLTQSPASQSMQRDSIEFTWNAVHLNFDFSFEIDIYAVITSQFVRVAKISNITSSTTRYMLKDTNILQLLSSFNNFWQLSILDNQGNICRSTPVFFTYER